MNNHENSQHAKASNANEASGSPKNVEGKEKQAAKGKTMRRQVSRPGSAGKNR
jgi:hypothetical protein